MADTADVAEFLKRRYARAIESGDDRTAKRLRAQIDRLINGPPTSRTLAGQIIDMGSWRSGAPAQPPPKPGRDDILYGYDDILAPLL